ncbi:DUF4389 domain-containing protein [Conexibacter sp. CPCC 206217]|uniref:DUF4389 domain-containing protein n=1 Tax=Conexibacter sp. CPCC 206217 TaxID=3064574 RepID=UPI00272321AC|nr:DUF4389 domain-containing protein [Conexibacter sp. CPCC 206217]MDO8209537.1 DUF4389 domain-containing protein [Conexibacter sp. CPCC 206217]
MYPVTFDAEFVEQRSRLTSFFRLIISIPWLIVSIFWGLGAVVCAVIAWFAIVFTGRYPQGLYDFVGKALRYNARVNAFQHLMTDRYPSFGGDEDPDYPVHLRIAPPLEHYSRVKTFFRVILMIPVFILLYLMEILARAIGVLSWVVIVVTGRQPKGLFDVVKLVVAYQARAGAYHLLVTETYPPLTPEDSEPGYSSSVSPA